MFLSLLVLSGVLAWLIVLAHESRRTAEEESARQTTMLMDEIEAHKRTDAELQKAKEVAEAANVAKTRYIVGVSHEIRTPLNSIFGYAQLLERGITGPTDNAIRVIRRSAEHMANLIDGLLDISRIENGLLRLNRDKVQLIDFLDQIVDMFRLQAAAKGIEFKYTRPPHLPLYVHTDEKRLRQILINLLSNAVKYTERGHASLTVRYRSQVAEFEISDTGVGIAQEDIERVFEPFERGSTPNVRSIPGTGLGLTITKLLAQIMGGELLARSTVGEGTVFTVRLLLSEARHDGRIPTLPRRVRGYEGTRRTILLVDDDPAHVDIVREVLTPLGFNVFTAQSGKAGMTLAGECRPDLALLDISMPDVTGWEVAKHLRTTATLRRCRVVIVSANAHEFAPGGDTAGHDAFIMKPVDIQGLLECIGNLLDIRWIFENASPATEAANGASTHNVSSHSQHHIDDLYQLGRIGHVRGIQSKLNELESADPDAKSFAAHLRTLIANFDLKSYMQALEGMRKNG